MGGAVYCKMLDEDLIASARILKVDPGYFQGNKGVANEEAN